VRHSRSNSELFGSYTSDHLPFFPSDPDKGPFGSYLSSVESKAPGADAGIVRVIEFRGEPLVELHLHLKVERHSTGAMPGKMCRGPVSFSDSFHRELGIRSNRHRSPNVAGVVKSAH
jgi:hypothetical protein